VPSVKATAADHFGRLIVRLGNQGRASGLTLGDAVRDLLANGMSPANVEATMLADLEAGGGRFFGQMFKGIRDGAIGGVDRALDAIEIVAYDDGITAAAKALDAGDLKAAREALDGINKSDLGADGLDTEETWITVLDNATCAGCEPRHGVTMTRREWNQVGRPRWGTTPCGDNCRCKLVPAAAAVSDGEVREDLKDPLTIPSAGKKVKV